MSALTSKNRQNEQELDALLEMDASTAIGSDTYVNNVEKLAINTELIPNNTEESIFIGTPDHYGLDIESEGYNEDDENLLERIDDTPDYLSIVDEDKTLGLSDNERSNLPKKNLFKNPYTSKVKQENDFGLDEEKYTFTEDWTAPLDPFKETEESVELHGSTYARRELKSELKKGATEADLDRVQKLSEEVSKESKDRLYSGL